MLILSWSLTLLTALFNVQYSYLAPHEIVDVNHITVTNGTLVTCIYPGDASFKKGSGTHPRSELRSKLEMPKGIYNISVDVLSVPNGTDYSLYQVFGKGKPLLMIRHRKGNREMVVFDGKPKIQKLNSWPEFCEVDCLGQSVRCGSVVSRGRLKCESLYFKVGVYHQGYKRDKLEVVKCASFGRVSYF